MEIGPSLGLVKIYGLLPGKLYDFWQLIHGYFIKISR
jgi:hypothetical protein